jgi:putative transposase
MALLDRTSPELTLTEQADLLGVNRTGIYFTPRPPSPTEVYIKRRIDEIYTAFPFFGSRKITRELRKEMPINRKAVQRHMREMGIAAVSPGPSLSRPPSEHQKFPYLLRNLAIVHPNQVWGIDITYIRLVHGWLYLVAVLDWFSRFVLSWELDQTLEIGFVLEAVDCALAQAKPEIWNSDQGGQFFSDQYLRRLQQAEVQISMDGKGRALDNIFTERLWRTVKYENVYLQEYETPQAARRGLGEYFPWYNHERMHQSLGYRTPAQVFYGEEGIR